MPPRLNESLDGGVTMSWTTFGGEDASLYVALLDADCVRRGLDWTSQTVRGDLFVRHLHRGINRMAGDIQLTSGPASLLQGAVNRLR